MLGLGRGLGLGLGCLINLRVFASFIGCLTKYRFNVIVTRILNPKIDGVMVRVGARVRIRVRARFGFGFGRGFVLMARYRI